MKKIQQKAGIRFHFNWLRTIPVYLFVLSSAQRHLIEMDIARWVSIYNVSFKSPLSNFNWLISYKKPFRNVLLHRFKFPARTVKGSLHYYVTRMLWKPLDSLYLETKDIGGGLFIQHGLSTIINAKRIGENCWINQQVNIGYTDHGNPVLEDNVTVHCGATVIGPITMHQNSVAGAGSVVVKDVPANAVVGGVPAKIINWKS